MEGGGGDVMKTSWNDDVHQEIWAAEVHTPHEARDVGEMLV